MGNFLVVVPQGEPAAAGQNEAAALFNSGIEHAGMLLSAIPNSQLSSDWFHAASFPRRNGSGTPIVRDPATGTWLLAIGSWFHSDGFSCGDENKLLDCYLRAGAESLGLQLEGSFVIVIGDSRSREVLAITDVCGVLHSFVRHTARGTAISGSSLLLASLSDFHLDSIAAQEFIATGVIYEDRCLYQEVRKLPPGSVVRIANGFGATASKRYWSPAAVEPSSLSGPESRRALWGSLHAVADKIGKAFPRPLFDLTGGYDSRAVVSACAAAGVRMATIVSGPPDSADVSISRGLAEIADLPHIHCTNSAETSIGSLRAALPLTDGEYDLVEYSRIQRTHELYSPEYSATINGSFGELARGYWWELLFPRLGACEPLNSQMLAARRYAAEPFDASVFRRAESMDFVAHFACVIGQTNRELLHAPNTLQMDTCYLLMRMQRWHGRIASSTNRIWPCISPFMFRTVLEVMLRTRAGDRRRSLLIRRMLAEFQPRWADFPLEHGYPAAPVTWKNFYRFSSVVGYYAGRALSRLPKRISRNPADAISGAVPPRLQLWAQDETRALLDPRAMLLSYLLDAAGLAAFLTRSQEVIFHYDEQWSRILTLELALRTLGLCGAKPLS